MGIRDKWDVYQPTKGTVFWGFAGGVALTLIVGFTWGGWVTGSSARDLANNAAEEAKMQVVSAFCVDRFVHSANARESLAELKEADSWDQESLLEDGGWVTVPGSETPFDEAADMCAERLVDMDPSQLGSETTQPG